MSIYKQVKNIQLIALKTDFVLEMNVDLMFCFLFCCFYLPYVKIKEIKNVKKS